MRRLQADQRETNLFLNDFEVCNRYDHALAAAALVTCPCTLILGERDQMTGPKHAAGIAAALLARTVVLPAGHALMTEVPDALLAALREALVAHAP